MSEPVDSWVVLLTAGMALTVVGTLAMDSVAWFVQYAVLGLGLLLSIFAAVRAAASFPSN
ncbi:hypothetical protein [Natrinema ejinorense]|uniref:hypothetical protein n=1 Tax=Natrinema ejinorense TaxID=373386 RepID=UPI00117E85A8|nr:hypothetical protein [Natrinema ejinorense]